MTYKFLWPFVRMLVAASMTSACTTGISCGPPVASDTQEWPQDIKPYDHIVVVMEENKDPEDISANCNHCAPFIDKLAKEGAYFTQMFGEEHVSQGNYFWLFSGSNQGVGHLDRPPDSPIDADNLGRALAQKAGRSFKGYVEDLPEPITTNETPQGCTLRDCVYGRKHVPWLGFTDFADDNNHLTTKPFSEWPHEGQFNILPTVAFVIPNLNHDMHNGPVAQSVPRGDTWLAEHMGSYYEWAKRNNSLLIVTFDESNDTNFIGLTDPHAYPGLESDYLRVRRNKIPTVIAGARIMHRDGGYDEGAGITHVNILRTIEAMYGLKKSGGQQGCAAAEGLSDHFITDVFARGGNSTTRAVP